jgi:hypothetical protein
MINSFSPLPARMRYWRYRRRAKLFSPGPGEGHTKAVPSPSRPEAGDPTAPIAGRSSLVCSWSRTTDGRLIGTWTSQAPLIRPLDTKPTRADWALYDRELAAT